jgi:hypothetical protein
MFTKHYLQFSAVVLVIFSLVLIFYPGLVFYMLGSETNNHSDLFVRFLGASMAGHAYVNWQATSFGQKTLQVIVDMNIAVLFTAVVAGIWQALVSVNLIEAFITLMHILFFGRVCYYAQTN